MSDTELIAWAASNLSTVLVDKNTVTIAWQLGLNTVATSNTQMSGSIPDAFRACLRRAKAAQEAYENSK